MWTFLKSALPPILLLLVALSMLIYGAVWHNSPVLVEEEKTPPPPPPPPPPGFFGQGPPPDFHRPQKPLIFIKTIHEPEYALILEATRGGVVRLDSGQLKRTYSGAPPAGCPT
jgi:hypothetical protein